MRIKWMLSKWLLFLLVFFIILFPGLGILWFVTKFDLPFVHGGEKVMIYFLGGFYWLVCSMFIFGFRLDTENTDL